MKKPEWSYQLPELNFVGRVKRSNRGNSDVTIAKVIRNKKYGKEDYSITFRNGFSEKVSGTGYLVFALTGNRLYFKEEDCENGIKLVQTNGGNRNTRPSSAIINLDGMIGDYDAKYDRLYGLWYVERAVRK